MQENSVKLVQLPIPDVYDIVKNSSIPLAASYLKAYIKSNESKDHAIQNELISIINSSLAKNGGDEAILKWLSSQETNVAGFTSYMWNIERSQYIAKKLKEIRPDIQIVFGGPEIYPGQPVMDNPNIDTFVIGEGEVLFSQYLNDLSNHKKLQRIYKSDIPLNLETLPNPYLEGVLTPAKGDSIYLETLRGCPYPCKFCFYSKSHSNLRYFSTEHLAPLFELGHKNNVSEIYLMDPSFNVAPGLIDRLKTIARLNKTSIPIHTEMRLESVTPEIADLMKAAGFISVEVGLQTTNKKSLDAIKRSWNKKKFIEGAQILRERGIEAKTGVILGLPHDTPESFQKTIDFLIDLDLHYSMEIYFLSMLPGTVLREEAQNYGMTFMSQPPYYVTETPHFTSNDFKYSIELIEQKLEAEFFPPVIPRFINSEEGFIHYIDLRKAENKSVDGFLANTHQIGNQLTIRVDDSIDKRELKKIGIKLLETNPFTLFQIVIESGRIPEEKEWKEVSDCFFNSHHYYNRLHYFKIDNQERFSVRFFHLVSDIKLLDSYFYDSQYCDPILLYSNQLINKTKGRELLKQNPFLLIENNIPSDELNKLKRLYSGYENYIFFKIIN